MKIVEYRIEDLKPYEKNPRNNDAAVDFVAKSIKEFGFRVPIVVDAGGVIVAGHTRWKAAKKLGLATVPCVLADDLSEEQVKAFRIADNKTGEKATWNDELLSAELLDLKGLDFNMDSLGFAKFELDLAIKAPEIQSYNEVYREAYRHPENIMSREMAQDVYSSDGGSYEYEPEQTKEHLSQISSELETKRVIIVYRTPEDEEYLKNLIGVDKLKVVIDIEELKAGA